MKRKNLLLSIIVLLALMTCASFTAVAKEKKQKAPKGMEKSAKQFKMEKLPPGPGLLLGKAKELELTKEQMSALKKLLIETRTKANAILTEAQVKKLKTLNMKAQKSKTKMTKKACPKDCTQPCCAKKK